MKTLRSTYSGPTDVRRQMKSFNCELMSRLIACESDSLHLIVNNGHGQSVWLELTGLFTSILFVNEAPG